MTDKIKVLEEQLAQAKTEEAKKAGFTVVVFEKGSDKLIEIKAKSRELNEKEKANLLEAAGKLGDNFEEIEKVTSELDNTVGPWLKLMALIEAPLKEIIAGMFGLELNSIATLPNMDLLSLIFQDNPWINSKADKLAKELEFISENKK
ncbi:hypothetical protein [Enterococcus pallens]|uniref:Uncharacterized protein n=1 Tax=Enterococcus pallens ATCC BAA-351 TaxID=1158607 RepID=R2RTP6_9ENTE|nr:hypothetical protein [Enterococcus pallens]EOH86695.1 hypothetical protein UAU_05140 [Enterococcus pallens ATCC BAA-351]EOU18491.1 hypothetical protein I588_03485 [Enterococcus pallens ATCC BAA-351]OJG76510.1 hypothetical protein RV10_GL003647 [Enterococcus pallens]